MYLQMCELIFVQSFEIYNNTNKISIHTLLSNKTNLNIFKLTPQQNHWYRLHGVAFQSKVRDVM